MVAATIASETKRQDALVDEEFFSVRLQQLRKAAGLTQAQLAERSGVKQNTISQLENGVIAPGWGTVIKLAEALGVTCESFRADPTKPPESPPAPPRRRGKGPA